MRKLFVAFFLSVVALTGRADNAMDTYVSQLMSRMTLEENSSTFCRAETSSPARRWKVRWCG